MARIEAVKSKATSDAKQPSVLKVTYSARTFADLEFTIDGVKTNEQEMLAVLNGLVLVGRVAGDGTFVEFYDFAAIQRRVQDAYRKEFGGRPGATSAAIKRAIGVGTSRDALQSEVTRTWNALVGRRVGLELTAGTSRVTSMPMYMPVIDRQVEMRAQWSIVGRERCSKVHVVPTCVRLRSSARPDAEALRKAIDEWVRGLGAPQGSRMCALWMRVKMWRPLRSPPP